MNFECPFRKQNIVLSQDKQNVPFFEIESIYKEFPTFKEKYPFFDLEAFKFVEFTNDLIYKLIDEKKELVLYSYLNKYLSGMGVSSRSDIDVYLSVEEQNVLNETWINICHELTQILISLDAIHLVDKIKNNEGINIDKEMNLFRRKIDNYLAIHHGISFNWYITGYFGMYNQQPRLFLSHEIKQITNRLKAYKGNTK